MRKIIIIIIIISRTEDELNLGKKGNIEQDCYDAHVNTGMGNIDSMLYVLTVTLYFSYNKNLAQRALHVLMSGEVLENHITCP